MADSDIELLPPDEPVSAPANYYDVIRLDLPYSNADVLDAITQGITDNRFQRIGKPIGIVKAMELFSQDVGQQWETVNRAFLNDNLKLDQIVTASMKVKFVIHDANTIPKFTDNTANIDSPMNITMPTFTYDFVRGAPGSLTSRKFGGNKEVGARMRFFAQLGEFQYPISAKSKEYQVKIRAFAHSTTMTMLMVEAFENYVEARRGFFFGLGFQHIQVEDSQLDLRLDAKGTIPYREFTLYIRTEKWFVGKPVPLIKSVTMDWTAALTKI